ncbi:MAG: hypothetical protein RBT59_13295 [Arcobacteraceae bacterium]|jgi:hypothetical protein|nr:hypothetical protein [Arcobacteraceae bacterium]
MEAVQSEYKCRKMHKLDFQRVFSFLNPHIENKTLLKDIKDHIRHGECFKLQNKDGLILGVFLAKRFNTHYSLSYYYLSEEVRRKPITLQFFLFCIKRLNPLFEMYVIKNKNYDSYSRYFTPTKDENILKFSGLRDSTLDDKFKEVLKWVE